MDKRKNLIHPRLDGIVLLLDLLQLGVQSASDLVRRKMPPKKQSQRGRTLRAGAATPLWNSLSEALKNECKKRGDQAELARFAGLPRQRINTFLSNNGPLPDAERTLMMLQWLAARRIAGDKKAGAK